MTLNQFHKLDEMEQVEVLWELGVQITERDEGEHTLILYQIDAFYVEVWYHKDSVLMPKRFLLYFCVLGGYMPACLGSNIYFAS